MSERPDELQQKIVRALNREVEQLDPAARARLRQARARALDELPQRHRHRVWWVPAGAAAAGLLVAWLWWDPARPPGALPAPADFEMLTTQEPLELYRELDFYLWLEREAGHAG